jgi:hypothetical protein
MGARFIIESKQFGRSGLGLELGVEGFRFRVPDLGYRV